MKKKYQKPLLTVLVRTRPEESVLDQGCKTVSGTNQAVAGACDSFGDCASTIGS